MMQNEAANVNSSMQTQYNKFYIYFQLNMDQQIRRNQANGIQPFNQESTPLIFRQFQMIGFNCPIILKPKQGLSIPLHRNQKYNNLDSLEIKTERRQCMELPTFGNWKQPNFDFVISTKNKNRIRKSLDLTIKYPSNPQKENHNDFNQQPNSDMLKQYQRVRGLSLKNEKKLKCKPKLVNKAEKHFIYDSIKKREVQTQERTRHLSIDKKRSEQDRGWSETHRCLNPGLGFLQQQRNLKIFRRYGINRNGEFDE